MAGIHELQRLIRELPGGTIAARLRKLMPDIDAKIKEGVTHEEILEVLHSQEGFEDLKLATFRSNLQRYRKNAGNTGRTATTPSARATTRSIPDGNPGADETADDDSTDTAATLDDIIDPKKRDESSEKYMHARPSLTRRSSK